jgi:hypothetical protein
MESTRPVLIVNADDFGYNEARSPAWAWRWKLGRGDGPYGLRPRVHDARLAEWREWTQGLQLGSYRDLI